MSPQINNPFRFSGPVTDADAVIPRGTALEAVNLYLSRNEYVSVLAPRQSGKTTFLASLGQLHNNYVYVDFAGFQCDRLRDVVHRLGSEAGLENGAAGTGLLGECLDAVMRSRKVVFLLDEVCAMGRVAVEFFRALRAYHGARVVGKRPFHLFVVADSIDPFEITLRDNSVISPYNIAHEVYLEDFSREEVRSFVRRLSRGRIPGACMDRVFEYTQGQPYLMQFLCSHLYGLPAAVARKQAGELATLMAGSRVDKSANVQTLLRRIEASPADSRPEMQVLASLLAGKDEPFNLLKEAVKKLYLEYGCIRNERDCCVIRNPIYRWVLESRTGVLPARTAPPPDEARLLNEVFVSYAWTDESVSVVDRICAALKENRIHVSRDREAVPFRASIREFMERMGRGHCLIVVLSKGYLESVNCMFELMEIAKRGNIRKRVFPLFLPDANITNAMGKLDYVKYWERREKELESEMAKVGRANLAGIGEELDRCVAIRAQIVGILDQVGDMNALRLSEHQASNFADLARSLEEELSKIPDIPSSDKPHRTEKTGE